MSLQVREILKINELEGFIFNNTSRYVQNEEKLLKADLGTSLLQLLLPVLHLSHSLKLCQTLHSILLHVSKY